MAMQRAFGGFLAALALAGTLAGCPAGQKPYAHAVLTPSPMTLPNTPVLTDMNGKPFKLDDLKGKWVWLYFGFTHCPDVCPVAMDYMAAEHKRLAKPGDVVPVFISVDPKRDDAATLKKYVTYYGPEFVGATGNKTSIDAVTKTVGAGYVLEPPSKPGGDYNVSHTNLIFVLDPEGRFVAGYAASPEAGDMAKDFDALPRS
jgi:protein SCO1/2